MKSKRLHEVESLYRAALKRERGQREAFLAEACSGDEELRREVESLLAYDERAERFLEIPAMELEAKCMAGDPASRGANLALTAGQRLGSLEITALIGRGGMGEVYRARDTKLKRDVAIKILPDEFSRDGDRVSRFQREAQVLASLNHPNIAAIYGLEEASQTRYLVLELVEGETLSDRIARGPIPVEEALDIATRICEALEAAHEKGIVHRDLKPLNVKITPDGKVKLLDFGLARTMSFDAPTATLSNSPTLLTGSMGGAIIGTAAYMSPEQAKGKAVDRRTDIFAFGCVLYEMLTGRAAFDGEDTTEILARVLQGEPDWNLLPPGTPHSIRNLLRLCLEKNLTKRRCDAGDVRIDIVQAMTGAGEVSPVPASSVARERLWMGVAAVFLVAIAALAILHFRETPPVERVFRLSVPLPQNSDIRNLALSPNGRELVLGFDVGKRQLWLRSLDSLQMHALPGTDLARSPFWSADGRTIGFFADNKLKIVPATGGPSQILCDGTGLGFGGTWNGEGVIVFGSNHGPLRRVNATGGACTAITRTEDGIFTGLPNFLPDGKHFLYTIAEAGDEARRGIYLASLDDPSGHRLLADASGAIFTPSSSPRRAAHIIFLRNGVLMAQPFDTGSLQPVGDAFQVASQASFPASASANGVLVYVANRTDEYQLTWFDRAGKEIGKLGEPVESIGLALSIDGNNVAVTRRDDQGQIWLRALSRDAETRFTFPPLSSAFAPVWSPDGTHIAFSSNSDLYRKQTGGGEEERLLPKGNPRIPSDWSRDGRFLLYTEIDPRKQSDIWYLPDAQGKPGNPVKFLQTDFAESQAQFSPDGNWVAYTSDESGTIEVYVRPFPDGPGKWRVSSSGGRQPRWRSDGKELFYLITGTRQQLMAVPVRPGPAGEFTIGMPQKVFDFRAVPINFGGNLFLYSPAPGGQRFLVNVLANTAEPTLNVIVNWQNASAANQ